MKRERPYAINWTNLPGSGNAAEILDICLSNEGSHPTPYQFTLLVLFAVYCSVQRDIKIGSINACDYVDSNSSEELKRYVGLRDVVSKNTRIVNPDYNEALRLPLRAIAYFSWEKERRVFLVRRVYPTHFDFLSYSHVPEGWGALGVMIDEVLAKKYRKKNKIYTPIFDVRDRRTLVPYLREVERLEYNSILVLPIFESDRFEISGLLGTVVFYLKDRSALPSEQVDVQAKFRALALQLGRAIVDHEKTIAGGSGLVDLLKREYSDQAKRNRRDLIAELTIILHSGGKEKDLDQVAATIMRQIGGNEYFGFADYDEADRTKRTIYVVSRDDVERRILEDRVCALIGKALKGKKRISYDLSFRRKGSRPAQGKVINE